MSYSKADGRCTPAVRPVPFNGRCMPAVRIGSPRSITALHDAAALDATEAKERRVALLQQAKQVRPWVAVTACLKGVFARVCVY